MRWICLLMYLSEVFIAGNFLYGNEPFAPEFPPDTSAATEQLLKNGRIWRDPHYRIEGNQFFLTNEFLPASVTINNKTFHNVRIRYDILNDEILTPVQQGIILLNKELTDSFTIQYQQKSMRFIRIPPDTLLPFTGYVQVVYRGKSSLFVKYRKLIDRPQIVNIPDNFYQTTKIYFVHDSTVNIISSKKELFEILPEKKRLFRAFIRKNRARISKGVPESFIPVLQYYDSLKP